MSLTWSQRIVLGQLEEVLRAKAKTAWARADEIAATFPPMGREETNSERAERVASIERELLDVQRLGYVKLVSAAGPAFQLTKGAIEALMPTERVCNRLKLEALERRLRTANRAMEHAVPVSPDLIRLYHAYLREWFERGNSGDPWS